MIPVIGINARHPVKQRLNIPKIGFFSEKTLPHKRPEWSDLNQRQPVDPPYLSANSDRPVVRNYPSFQQIKGIIAVLFWY